MQDNLPADLIKLLSFHGPVEVWVGPPSDRRAASVGVAPFEDVVFVLLPRGSGAEKALLRSCRAELVARAKDRSYTLKLLGRAQASLPVTSHPRCGEILPWVPEGLEPHRLLAVPLVPEEIEYVTTDGKTSDRRAGATPAKKDKIVWWKLAGMVAFGGLAIPFALAVPVVSWAWLAWQGPEYPLRSIAFGVSAVSGLSAVAASRLWALAFAFGRWRKGKADPDDAPYLTDGYLAPRESQTLAAICAVVAVVGWFVLAWLWGTDLALVSVVPSGFWLLVPTWWLHLSTSKRGRRAPS